MEQRSNILLVMKDTKLKSIIVVTDHENTSISHISSMQAVGQKIFVKSLIHVMLFCLKANIAFLFPKGKTNYIPILVYK